MATLSFNASSLGNGRGVQPRARVVTCVAGRAARQSGLRYDVGLAAGEAAGAAGISAQSAT